NSRCNGWAAAGFWFVKLANMQDLVQRSIAAVPTATGPSPESASVLEYYAAKLPGVLATMQKGGANVTGLGIGNEQGGTNTWDNVKAAIRNLDPTIIIKKAFTTGMTFVINDGEHPLLAIKRIGNTTLAIAGSGFATCIALLATLGNAPGVGMAIASAMFMAVIPLAIIGVTLSYIIPLMPALIWISILIGWFIQIIEAVIASSIWAVQHLHPSGDDLVGKGGNGYNLVLGIIFRPVLSVFGLMAALLSMQIFGQFINKVFADAFLVAQQDSGLFIWLIGLIVAPLVYCVSMFTIVKKLFEIVHIIPDQLMQWIGGGSHTLGEYAKSMGGGGDHSQALAAGMNVVNQQGNNVMGGIADMKKNEKPGGGKLNDAAMTAKGLGTGQKDMLGMMQGGGKEKNMSESALSMKSQHEGNMKELSSANPELGSQYEKNLESMSNNPKFADMSSDELMGRAMETTIRQNYGQGAVSAMKNYAGGSMSGEKFQSALNSYETAKQGAVADYGSNGYKKEMMTANKAINDEFQSNAKQPVEKQVAPSEIFSKHLGQFNDVDAIAKPPEINE
ncbi:DotA/TraY family protein, partial [Patescibacteria group bacterium]|nr:DotA/TraY family protein [Patescibacteria group bacterium]